MYIPHQNEECCRVGAAEWWCAIPNTRNPKSEIRNPKPELGFSLIELLTVIAIIAILAAMVFPIMGSIRQRSHETHAISNLHNISQSLAIFRLDERAFPPALGEYWEGNPPARHSPLFSEYLKNRDALHADGTIDVTGILSNTQPTISPGLISYEYTAGPANVPADDPTAAGAAFASDDSMDGGWERRGGNWAYVLHYSRYRLPSANNTAAKNPADPDYKRQMQFRNPPDDTVVTWITDFRSYVDDVPTQSSNDIVLYLNGTAEKRPAREVEQQGWRLLPRSEMDSSGHLLY